MEEVVKDDIAAQEFKQIAREKWQYEVVSKKGRRFFVNYSVQPYGYIKEVLTEGTTPIWDREFKAGENVKNTWVDHIKNT